MTKVIFVTGATGLIGQRLVKKLVELKYEVYVGARDMKRAYELFENSVHYIRYDSTKELLLPKGINYIIHAASNAHPSVITEQPVETLLSNLSVKDLLKYAKENNSRLLYVSSVEVYGQGEGNFKEGDYGYVDHLNVRNSYPTGKRVAESLCSAYAKEYGVDAVIARPCHIYGPTARRSDSRIGSSFIFDALDKKDIVLKSSGMNVRDYCYVDDCVDALLTILEKGNTGEAYNIGGETVSVKEFAEAVAKEGKVKVKFEMPTEQEHATYNKMSNASVDCSKLEKLGWKRKYTLKKGIKTTLKELHV